MTLQKTYYFISASLTNQHLGTSISFPQMHDEGGICLFEERGDMLSIVWSGMRRLLQFICAMRRAFP